MSKSQIHLIRHGITEGNVKRWYYGSSDIPLLQEGIDALTELVSAGIYPLAEETEVQSAVLYTSGLIRTEQTFAAIYGDKKHRVIEEFKELNFGDFEAMTHEQLCKNPLYQTWIDDSTGTLAPPKGESPQAFYNRVKEGFYKLMDYHRLLELSVCHSEKDAHSIVVCHGGVISAIMRFLFSAEDKNLYEWIPDPGHGYSLTLDGALVIAYDRF